MSICYRNGIRYNRHKWKKQKALADVTTCEHCSQVKGGVYESRDSESEVESTSGGIPYRSLHEVPATDGGVSVSAGDNGDVGPSQGLG